MRGRKKSEETREAILRCASEVFSERPFHEALTDDISARLGIGKGTLYRYFSSKEELYFASILRGLEGMQEAVSDVLHGDAPLEPTLEKIARTVIAYFWERRDFFVLLYRHEPKLDPEERAEWQKRREEHVETVAQLLARELRLRGLNGTDPRLAVQMFFGMIRSVCLARSDTDRVDDLARLVTRIFLNGLLVAPGAGRNARTPARRRASAPRRELQ